MPDQSGQVLVDNHTTTCIMQSMIYTYSDDLVSDIHKDAYGFRPSKEFYMEWDNLTPDGKQEVWNQMAQAIEDSIRLDQEMEAVAVVKFENAVTDTMKEHQTDRDGALKILQKACQIEWDLEYMEYHYGLPYGYLTKGQA